jgi:CheY-like chemotaxis protein
MRNSLESPAKILLADDSVTMHRAVALALKRTPWTLLTVDNGEDALRIALEHRPDIVIADLEMPGLTGTELIQKIREKPILSGTKTVLLLGSFDQIDESHLEAVPADGRLWKPFESDVLLSLLETLLKAPRESAAPTLGAPSQNNFGTGSAKTLPPIPPAGIPRVADEPTIPPIRSTPQSQHGDLAQELTDTTFKSVSNEQALANLWSPVLEGGDDPTLPPVGSSPQTALPPRPFPSENGPEFSSFRSVNEIILPEPPRPPLETESWLKDAESSLTLPPSYTLQNPTTNSASTDNMSEGLTTVPQVSPDELRAVIREEIERAFDSWLKSRLEATLAHVLAEIDRT